MPAIPIEKTISVVQTAVSPVIMISGVGLLLLTMTNRLGRAIDRIRALSSGPSSEDATVRTQIDVLFTRARLLRNSILCAVGAALTSSLLVIVIFLMLLWGTDFGKPLSVLFILSMGFVSVSLVFFARDVHLSLSALEQKLRR